MLHFYINIYNSLASPIVFSILYCSDSSPIRSMPCIFKNSSTKLNLVLAAKAWPSAKCSNQTPISLPGLLAWVAAIENKAIL